MIRWPLRTEVRIARHAVSILEPRERKLLLLLVPPTMLVALLEVLGIASLAPFIALLSEPERFMKHRVLRWAYTTFGFTSLDDLFFCVGLGILLLLVISNTTAAATMWATLRFVWMRSASLSTRLLRGYLHRPYAFFLERNVADLLRKSLADVQAMSLDVMLQMMSLVSRLFGIILISITLFIIEPVLAAGAIIAFGGIYGGLFMFSRRRATRAGKARAAADIRRFKIAMEALNGAKEIKLYRLEDASAARFRRAAVESSTNAVNHQTLSLLPRYALETVAFGGVLAMMLYLLKTRHSIAGALPLLGIYAFAAVRLLPALQGVFAAFNSLRFNSTIADVLVKEFATSPVILDDGGANLPFEREVRLEDVCFSYASAERPILKNISATLKRGEWVGFVGPTGSGKSTLVDIVLGLLEASSGTVTIDGAPLTPEVRRAWQAQTAYVPQQMVFIDDTVAANICFGVPTDQIDHVKLERVARVAQIHDFITCELPNGYQTGVGDKGIRLSGGQRQRLGIARALYREPRFLVLDEATSALDGATESAFFQALRADLEGVTVVSITHRLTTTRNFDRVYRLESGEIVGEALPETLIQEAEQARVS